jgi:hypothetical protein
MNLETLQTLPPWQWPTDAGNTILKVLVDREANESARIDAAELGGDLVVMDDRLAEALLAIVRNDKESEQLRHRSAISLGPVLEQAFTEEFDGEFDDPEAVPISKGMYHKIKESLHEIYADDQTPKEVRRRVLEAAVRASDDWQKSAIKTAYASGDRDWMLTAVFAMRWVPGFNDQILEALNSTDPDIHYEAILGAGARELDAAWSHVLSLVEDPATPKPLLLAAIEAVGSIRPREAGPVLVDLTDSEDTEIAEAAEEAMMMADAVSGEGIDDDEESGEEWEEEEEESDEDEELDEDEEEDEDEEQDEDEGKDKGDWLN